MESNVPWVCSIPSGKEKVATQYDFSSFPTDSARHQPQLDPEGDSSRVTVFPSKTAMSPFEYRRSLSKSMISSVCAESNHFSRNTVSVTTGGSVGAELGAADGATDKEGTSLGASDGTADSVGDADGAVDGA